MRGRQVTAEELVEAVRDSVSYQGVLRYLGMYGRGDNPNHIRRRIELAGLDISHFTHRPHPSNANKLRLRRQEIVRDIQDRLVKSEVFYRAADLLSWLLEAGLKQNKCEVCNQKPEWNNLPLPMSLHHINGNNKDNRIENLQVICPNCHRQTDNFSGHRKDRGRRRTCDCGVQISPGSKMCRVCHKKKMRKERRGTLSKYSPDQLQGMLDKTSYCTIAKAHNISETAVRKHFKKHVNNINEVVA